MDVLRFFAGFETWPPPSPLLVLRLLAVISTLLTRWLVGSAVSFAYLSFRPRRFQAGTCWLIAVICAELVAVDMPDQSFQSAQDKIWMDANHFEIASKIYR